ncbi:MAG: DegT/DnrJ/EryC1/StrS family aminotransferase [Acidobacteriota bacterium]
MHLQECFVSLGHQRGEFPASEQAANETLALPIYPELSDDDKARIVAVIATSGLV